MLATLAAVIIVAGIVTGATLLLLSDGGDSAGTTADIALDRPVVAEPEPTDRRAGERSAAAGEERASGRQQKHVVDSSRAGTDVAAKTNAAADAPATPSASSTETDGAADVGEVKHHHHSAGQPEANQSAESSGSGKPPDNGASASPPAPSGDASTGVAGTPGG